MASSSTHLATGGTIASHVEDVAPDELMRRMTELQQGLTGLSAMDAHWRAQDSFDAVMAAVPAETWDRPCACAQWTLRDVAGHVIWARSNCDTGRQCSSSTAVQTVLQAQPTWVAWPPDEQTRWLAYLGRAVRQLVPA